NLASPLRREQHALETVRNFKDTVFDGNARHSTTLREPRKPTNIWELFGDGNSSVNRVCVAVRVPSLTLIVAHPYMVCHRPDGRVAMQRTANTPTAVRFRFRPQGVLRRKAPLIIVKIGPASPAKWRHQLPRIRQRF